jgi:hypothetical protein
MQVVAAAEPIEPNVKFASLSAALFDSTGRMTGQVNANENEIAQLPALTGMIVSSGTYRLRVAATDTAGRAGAADIEVVAETVAAGPLKLSSLVLGVSREGRFQPRLQFSTEPVAIAYLEIFGSNVKEPVGAIIEVLSTDGRAARHEPIVARRHQGSGPLSRDGRGSRSAHSRPAITLHAPWSWSKDSRRVSSSERSEKSDSR